MVHQATRLQESQFQLENKRQELVETIQDQKTLENLRDRYQANQAQELRRREASTIDDIVITRYGRER